MTQLTATLSEPLLGLIESGQAPVDGIEAGPWFSVRQLREHLRALPDYPFYFHGGRLLDSVGLIPGTVSRIKDSVDCTGSPWASMHMGLWPPGMVRLMLRYGVRLPRPHPGRAKRRLVGRVQRLARALDVPVILENMPSLPFDGREFEAEPSRLNEVLQETGCALLLDLGHARVAAGALGLDVHEYLERLPLRRVVQLHVSGPRVRDGRLVDAHEPMLDVDYELLGYVLDKTNPRVVTLEYFRERDALIRQLVRLRGLLDARAASKAAPMGART